MTHISSTRTSLVGTQTLLTDTRNSWDPLPSSWGNGCCEARRGERGQGSHRLHRQTHTVGSRLLRMPPKAANTHGAIPPP